MNALSFLRSLDARSLILLFWYTTLLEIPRYVIGGLVASAVALWWRPVRAVAADLRVSVVLVGHNEQRSLRGCVEALAEQTLLVDGGVMQVVVVDDGSTDLMMDVARGLKREGKIDTLLRLEHRSGKSAGVNLALSVCREDIIIIADIDTTFDRDAFAEMLAYFADPRVGAVSGNLGVRNLSTSLMTRVQAIEYAIGFSLGRRVLDALGILPIVSGAFGAFRRAAIEQVGRQDVEVGEDAGPHHEIAPRQLAYPVRAGSKCADHRAGNRRGVHRPAAEVGPRTDHDLDAQVPRRLRPAPEHVRSP
jgi:cellulose synthase/poly-beta-1,6-N-acetylglucosamine synthase-like glycosyltransferase